MRETVVEWKQLEWMQLNDPTKALGYMVLMLSLKGRGAFKHHGTTEYTWTAVSDESILTFLAHENPDIVRFIKDNVSLSWDSDDSDNDLQLIVQSIMEVVLTFLFLKDVRPVEVDKDMITITILLKNTNQHFSAGC